MNLWERQKQRREYLKKKAGVYARNTRLICVCLLLVFGGFRGCIGLADTYTSQGGFLQFLIAMVGSTMIMIVLGAAMYGGEIFFGMKDEIKAIPYVPPVDTTDLSAEEVLVRGAQEPTQEQSAILLRAAGESADPPEQLLRAADEENDG